MVMMETTTMNDWERLSKFLKLCAHDDVAFELGHTYIRIFSPDLSISIVYRFDENGKVVSIE